MATKPVTPPLLLALLEARGLFELALFAAVLPFSRHLPAGEQWPVMVLPGFMANDASTFILRRRLTRLGYTSYGWGQESIKNPVDRGGASINPSPSLTADRSILSSFPRKPLIFRC